MLTSTLNAILICYFFFFFFLLLFRLQWIFRLAEIHLKKRYLSKWISLLRWETWTNSNGCFGGGKMWSFLLLFNKIQRIQFWFRALLRDDRSHTSRPISILSTRWLRNWGQRCCSRCWWKIILCMLIAMAVTFLFQLNRNLITSLLRFGTSSRTFGKSLSIVLKLKLWVSNGSNRCTFSTARKSWRFESWFEQKSKK